jgi:hypothetical protein
VEWLARFADFNRMHLMLESVPPIPSLYTFGVSLDHSENKLQTTKLKHIQCKSKAIRESNESMPQWKERKSNPFSGYLEQIEGRLERSCDELHPPPPHLPIVCR